MSQASINQRTRTRGFSFVEVLFAVMILGVGFIMVAAMFPVAIQQTQLTVDEVAGGRIINNAQSVLKSIPASLTLSAWPASIAGNSTAPAPATTTDPYIPGRVLPFSDPTIPGVGIPNTNTMAMLFTNYIQGSRIDHADPRYAWTALYQRDSEFVAGAERASHTIRLYIFALGSRANSTFVPADEAATSSALNAQVVRAQFNVSANTITFIDTTPATGERNKHATTGAFVVVSNDTNAAVSSRINGQVYRLTRQINPNEWELEANRDIPSYSKQPIEGAQMDVCLVGARLKDPTMVASPTNVPEGAAQDISLLNTALLLEP